MPPTTPAQPSTPDAQPATTRKPRTPREGPSPSQLLIASIRAAWEAGVSFDQARPILDMIEASTGVSGYSMLADTLTMYAAKATAKATADAKPSA